MTDAFMALSNCLAERSGMAPLRLSELAMKLTGAGSAGISLEDMDEDSPVFRWIATAGEFSRYSNGTMPRNFSPCGTVVDRRKTLLMADPGRRYEYIRTKLHAPIRTALLVPYIRQGHYAGTLWVISHQEGTSFTTSDVQAIQSLTIFASTVLDSAQNAKH
jgi:GAF domain-containing protein